MNDLAKVDWFRSDFMCKLAEMIKSSNPIVASLFS